MSLIIILIIFVENLFALEKALDFKLENMKGKQVKLSDFLEKGPVILDFWATWCEPCKKELPALSKVQDMYNDSITVITVSCDKPRNKNKAKAYIKAQKLNVVNLFDTKKDVQKLFNVTNIPRTLIIAPDSTIIFDHTGYQRGNEKYIIEAINKWFQQTENEEVTE
jgi:peroxiredoxin